MGATVLRRLDLAFKVVATTRDPDQVCIELGDRCAGDYILGTWQKLVAHVHHHLAGLRGRIVLGQNGDELVRIGLQTVGGAHHVLRNVWLLPCLVLLRLHLSRYNSN